MAAKKKKTTDASIAGASKTASKTNEVQYDHAGERLYTTLTIDVHDGYVGGFMKLLDGYRGVERVTFDNMTILIRSGETTSTDEE
jgi:hypothetical protein